MPLNRSAVRVVVTAILLFIGASTLSAQTGAPADGEEEVSFWAELAFWESVKDSRDAGELEAYISRYPEGRFTDLAKIRIRALGGDGMAPRPAGVRAKPATVADSASGQDGSESSTRQLKPGDIFRDCDSCPQMVVVPPGQYAMGSNRNRPEELPSHRIDIPQAFAIGTHEVSVDEWDACLREGACRQPPAPGRKGNLPMANISWNDAQGYLKWLQDKTGETYRLPSEAEWEYAARAGSTTTYWWGNETGENRANCRNCGSPWDGKDASPTGSFPPNPFALHDTHGNVWEWTQDCWNPSYSGAPGDSKAWLRGDCLSRVLRGGSWALEDEYMRSSRRSRYDRDVRYYLNGFRAARDLPAVGPKATEDALPTFEEAVGMATNTVFSTAEKRASGATPRRFVVDPLIDGLSGEQTIASRHMASIILDLTRRDHGGFNAREFVRPAVSESRYLIIGTFTGVNKQRKTTGIREAFRICLAMLDTGTGTITSKAKVFSRAADVDITPTVFFQDSPVWLADPTAQAYIKTCQATKPGDAIDPLYLERLETSAVISEAIGAYENGEYKRSRNLFKLAAGSPGGDQLRTYNGLYLTGWRLGDGDEAARAFSRIVDHALDSGSFSVVFPFRKGSTDLDQDSAGQQELWLSQIAGEVDRRGICLEIIGHTNSLGPEPLNQRLAIRRAEQIKWRLEAKASDLVNRMIASGKGAQDNLVGSRSHDARDALDRRIEFSVIPCDTSK